MLLAFDTCFSSCSAAILDLANARVLSASATVMQTGHAEALPFMVEDALRQAKVTWDDVHEIAVTTGPGTFTGVRIGTSFAQGLAIARGIKVRGIDSMTATAAPFLETSRDVTVIHLAGATGKYYFRSFDGKDASKGQTVLISPTAIDWSRNRAVIGTGVVHASNGMLAATEFDVPIAGRFAPLASSFRGTTPQFVIPHYLRTAHATPNVTSPSFIFLTADQAQEISDLQIAAFGVGWGKDSLMQTLFSPGVLAIGARTMGQLASVLIARTAASEAELLIVATLPSAQRKGFASELLALANTTLKRNGIEKLLLDVAADNTGALALYTKTGFIRYGIRKGYYKTRDGDPTDAILMKRNLA
jgi:tRNA threonylcarbamoyl adenosine modification protein YeaZ